MPILCPHFKITIVKRSQGQSAVAGAAYQSGERLFSEYDQRTKFYNKKKELVHAEIMLPSHAPPGFADRATLWNAVEAVENQWNSQLARRIVLAFPVEVPKERYLKMIREFCKEQFVSKGMCMNFNHEELMLMMLYNTGTRLGLIHELRLIQCYLMPDEIALRELSEGVIEKLKLLTDAEFAELEFPPD